MLCVISKISSLLPNVRNLAAKPTHILRFTKTMATKPPPGKKLKQKTKPCTQKVVQKPTTKSKITPGSKKSMPGKGGSATGCGSKVCSETSGGSKQTSSQNRNPGSYIIDKCDIFDIPKGNSRPYRNISYCILPLIVGFSAYVLTMHEERDLHFVPYEYMYNRSKRFAWGDGRTTLFHGPNNIIPEEQEYEKVPNRWEKDLEKRKILRDKHVKEELERRNLRHEREK